MLRLNLTENKITIIVAIFIIVALGSCIAYAKDDNNRHYKHDNPSVFSPGYMNAEIQHVNNILRQESTGKGPLDNLVSYLQDKIRANMKRMEAEKAEITPDLQRKAGNIKAEVISNLSVQNEPENSDKGPSYGDIDGNGWVGVSDLNILLCSYNKKKGDAKYRADADLNHDGVISNGDLNILLHHFGTAVPAEK